MITRKELLDAAEQAAPILNHLDELEEEAMKAIFFEKVMAPTFGKIMPLISPTKEKILASGLGRDEYVIYKGACSQCGKPLEFKLRKTAIVTHSFPFYQNFIESCPEHRRPPRSYIGTSSLTEFVEHGPYSLHYLLIEKDGERMLCEDCYKKRIQELEVEINTFVSGDVLGWAQGCNSGLIPQEELWKKNLFTTWKVHQETQRVVELLIDDRYYWIDDDFKKEVNEAPGDIYRGERRLWRKEDIPERSDKETEQPNKRPKQRHDANIIVRAKDDPFSEAYCPSMDYYTPIRLDDEASLVPPTDQTKEFIEKVCQPCEPSLILFTKEMMEYILKAEGVDAGAVMRHNKFILYKDYLRTPYWNYVSQRMKWVARYKCSRCDNDKDLQVHHLTYEHRGIEAKYPEDLICLCRECHRKEHEKENGSVGIMTSDF